MPTLSGAGGGRHGFANSATSAHEAVGPADNNARFEPEDEEDEEEEEESEEDENVDEESNEEAEAEEEGAEGGHA